MRPKILMYMLNEAVDLLLLKDGRIKELHDKVGRTDDETRELDYLLADKYDLIADVGIDYKETCAITENFISKIKKENEEYPAIRFNMLSDKIISNDTASKSATDCTAIKKEALQLLINRKCKEINIRVLQALENYLSSKKHEK